MSLVGWWKLDGSAEDSIGSYNGYEQGSPSYSNGKIGDCYDNTSGGSNGVELIRHSDFVEYEDYYSFSLWFKSTTTSGNGGARIISRDYSEYATVLLSQNESSPQSSSNKGLPDFSVSVNQWHHLAFSVDVGSDEARIFLDGELVGTSSTHNTEANRPYVIGGNTEGDGDISGNHFEGKIDDVRLYDHKLSKKEVKQLSRAKVLHYKFDDFAEYTENIIKDSRLEEPDMDYGWKGNASSNTVTKEDNSAPYPEVVRLEKTGSDDQWHGMHDNTEVVSLSSGDHVTYSGWYRLESGATQKNLAGLNWVSDGWDTKGSKSITMEDDELWHRFEITVEITQDYSDGFQPGLKWAYSTDQQWLELCGVQIETKDHATPFVAGTRKDKVVDSSGQGNHGPLDSDTPTWIENSKIGSGAYSFEGDKIPVKNLYYDSASQLPELTLSAWIKVDSSGQVINSWDRSEFWRFGVGGSTGSNAIDIGLADENGVSDISANTDVTDGNWHHVVFVYDHGSVTFYLDGEVDGTASTGGNAIGQNLTRYGFIGDYSEADSFNTGSGGSFTGEMDDIRIYHSALNQSEIQQLYKQRASIDGGGNLHSHELHEAENKFDDFAGGVNSDTEVLGAQDGFENVYKVDARENDSYENFLTNLVKTSDWSNSGSGNYLYLVYWAKGNNIPDWSRSENIQYPSPSTSEYQKYVFRNDGQNSRDEYFRQFFGNSDSTSYAYIADPKIFTQSEYKKRNGVKSSGIYSMDEFNEIGPGADSLVGYWPLDGDTRDYSGNGNHGTNNGATVTSGLGQSAYSFDGTSSYISGSGSFTFDNLTFSAWVRYDSDASGGSGSLGNAVISSQSPTFQSSLYADMDSNEQLFYVYPDNASSSTIVSTSISKGKWLFVTGVVRGSNVVLYINGIEKGSNTLDTDGSISWGDPFIGRGNSSEYLDGKIQDVRIFNRALTEEEIKTLYNLTDPRQDQRAIQGKDGTVYTKGEFNELL
ncbi:LamG domain-containing protein [Candidatus Nanohalobium constans]|uniref:Concanavalin A-like lectin/glucanases superfamily n=1 Tax=Candidatus Nanohalobium constans TaxID=2565781 RepID=A0A5Q0UFL4_9ARCH|nr:LamG domain-containing protein [Candidatus Nanohalobium constans]QGA80324.1 concanavalin A-like lectin/glucanases superfamily [Candidatus Nanohalobium constans]